MSSSADTDNKKQKSLPPKMIMKLLRNPVVKSLIYGRVVLIFVLILLQIFLFLLFIYRLFPYNRYFLVGSMLLSFFFSIFIVNSAGKNEYKLAWLLPVIIMPLLGIGLYLLFHFDFGIHALKKKIRTTKQETMPYMVQPEETRATVTRYPQLRGIASYLSRGGYAAYTGIDAQYFASGEQAFPAMLADIQQAHRFIFIEYFIINPGYMWDTMVTELIKKAESGVEVRVLYDSFGSTALSPGSYASYLESVGIKAHAFIPLIPVISTHLNNRDHRKILDIDGTCAYTGGINISDEYINRGSKLGYWKDTVIKIHGNAVRSFTGMFLRNWNIADKTRDDYGSYMDTHTERTAAQGAFIPYGDDAYNDEDVAENVYSAMIAQAQRTVCITTPYLVIDNQLFNALVFAVRRGVAVSIILPAKFDHYITGCIGRLFAKLLGDNGVHVYEYTPGFIHAKMCIVDGCCAAVGSINFDYRSLYNQFECGVLMYGAPVIGTIEQDFEKTIQQSTALTTESYKKSPVVNRIIGRVFKIVAPLV